MRAYEFLTEQELDEINRREFLTKAGMATMGAALGTAAVDQGAHAAEPEQSMRARLPVPEKHKWIDITIDRPFSELIEDLPPIFADQSLRVANMSGSVVDDINTREKKAVYKCQVYGGLGPMFMFGMVVYALDDNSTQVLVGTRKGLPAKRRLAKMETLFRNAENSQPTKQDIEDW